ncbi:MAG: DUF1667 domain-containing protein [Erysipelotrichaceae bacterium]
MKKEMICIVCPKGCHLSVELDNSNVISILGNTCPRGEEYARSECIAPMRTLTTTIVVEQGEDDCVPVITSQNVPKAKLFDIMEATKNIVVKAPILSHDIILHNVANSGADLIATCNVKKRE